MSFVKKMLLGAAVAITGLVAGAPAASAGSFTVTGDTNTSTNKTGADYSCSFSYNASTQLLTLSLTNTTNKMEGGYLTGFCFDTGNSADTATLVSCSNSHFDDLCTSTQSNALANPFGTFHDGAGLGGTFSGLGSPNCGTVAGATDTFCFKVTGKDALSLNSGSFCNDGFACSFADIDCLSSYCSDKVDCKPAAVPLPASAWSGLMAFVGLGAVGLRFRRRSIAA